MKNGLTLFVYRGGLLPVRIVSDSEAIYSVYVCEAELDCRTALAMTELQSNRFYSMLFRDTMGFCIGIIHA